MTKMRINIMTGINMNKIEMMRMIKNKMKMMKMMMMKKSMIKSMRNNRFRFIINIIISMRKMRIRNTSRTSLIIMLISITFIIITTLNLIIIHIIILTITIITFNTSSYSTSISLIKIISRHIYNYQDRH